MLDICRIIIAGTLLFGSTVHSSLIHAAPTHAAGPGRTLPRASHPIEAAACKPGWPLRAVTCTA